MHHCALHLVGEPERYYIVLFYSIHFLMPLEARMEDGPVRLGLDACLLADILTV